MSIIEHRDAQITWNIDCEEWKQARLCPIFKVGERNYVKYNSAVAMLSNVSKTIIKKLYDLIFKLIKKRTFSHHGFMLTISNLHIYTLYISYFSDEESKVRLKMKMTVKIYKHNLI